MMRRSKKIAILTSCALIIVGFVLALSALIVMKFDLSRLNTLDYHTATYPIQESFPPSRWMSPTVTYSFSPPRMAPAGWSAPRAGPLTML